MTSKFHQNESCSRKRVKSAFTETLNAQQKKWAYICWKRQLENTKLEIENF